MSGGERPRQQHEGERAPEGPVRRQRAQAVYIDMIGGDASAAKDFDRTYIGSYQDLARWAEVVMEDFGWWEQLEGSVDHRLLPHLRVDFVSLGRELSYDAHVIHDDGDAQNEPAVHIFRLHG